MIELKNVKTNSIFLFLQLLAQESNTKLRGPYLARLALHKKMCDLNLDADLLLGNYQDLLIEYFRNFGNKKCCTNDLKRFLENLDVHQRSELATKILHDTGITSTTLPQNVRIKFNLSSSIFNLITLLQKDQLQKHICSLQISRLCGSHVSLSIEHLQALYSAFSLHYEHSFGSFGKDLLSTDIGPSDQYALLAGELGLKCDSKFFPFYFF